MAFLVATTSLPAVYRPNGYARTTTARANWKLNAWQWQYLFIDDIERHHADAVELLLPCRSAHWVEVTAGDGGEHRAEGVGQLCPGVLVMGQVGDSLGAIPATQI